MSDMSKPRRKWSGPEKWQVWIGLGGLLVAVIATVGQYMS